MFKREAPVNTLIHMEHTINEHRAPTDDSVRAAAIEVAVRELIECWGELAILNEAAMAVWKDKLSLDMLRNMTNDRTRGFAAVKVLRDLGL